MFILTIDQRDSAHSDDGVPQLLDRLSAITAVRPFVRTVGDEVQGVLDTSESVIDVCETVVRAGRWSIGIGVGDGHEELGESAPASRGLGFQAAREAVEAAKTAWVSVALRSGNDIHKGRVADAQTLLRVLLMLAADATDKQWQIMTAMRVHPDSSQEQIARRVGVSQQAVSKVFRAGRGHAMAEVRESLRRQLAAFDSTRVRKGEPK